MAERPADLDTLAEQATTEYLRRANRVALENMIALCLYVMSPREMAEFLRAQAAFIEDFG